MGQNHITQNISYINISVNKAELMKLQEDSYGEIHLTIKERKNADSGPRFVVYEDVFIKEKKNESRKPGITQGD